MFSASTCIRQSIVQSRGGSRIPRRRGRQPSRRGRQHMILTKISKKPHQLEKILAHRGGHIPGVPPQIRHCKVKKWCNVLNAQVRIQDLVKGGPQVLRPKLANVAKWSRAIEASKLQPGSRACLRALEAFGFLMLKYAFSHILETLFL